jgi:hypothetical protein
LRWWAALIAGGPGWIVIGAIKILAGSFLAVLTLNHGIGIEEAADPTRMYMVAFSYIASSPEVALSVAGIFVILSQLKINVTNAYAGSIAWSNFFSRLCGDCIAADGAWRLSRIGTNARFLWDSRRGLVRFAGGRSRD